MARKESVTILPRPPRYEVALRDAEVIRVKPGEFLLIHVDWPLDDDDDFEGQMDSFVSQLVAAGLKKGQFAVVNDHTMKFVVVDAPSGP